MINKIPGNLRVPVESDGSHGGNTAVKLRGVCLDCSIQRQHLQHPDDQEAGLILQLQYLWKMSDCNYKKQSKKNKHYFFKSIANFSMQ